MITSDDVWTGASRAALDPRLQGIARRLAESCEVHPDEAIPERLAELLLRLDAANDPTPRSRKSPGDRHRSPPGLE